VAVCFTSSKFESGTEYRDRESFEVLNIKSLDCLEEIVGIKRNKIGT
jgi:hypothetical protein